MDLYDSLHNIPLDRLAEKVGGRHRLTYLVSQRLIQVNNGAPLLVERGEDEAILAAVCREVDEGKIWLDASQEELHAKEDDLSFLGIDEISEN